MPPRNVHNSIHGSLAWPALPALRQPSTGVVDRRLRGIQMKEKGILKALTSALILATTAELSLHAQSPQQYQGTVGRTLAESKEWWPEPVKAPAGAPNVVWVLLDDV